MQIDMPATLAMIDSALPFMNALGQLLLRTRGILVYPHVVCSCSAAATGRLQTSDTNALVLDSICSCPRLIDTNACQLIWSSPFLFLNFPLSLVPYIFFEPWLINFSGD
jgi:hypothetical protein